jgi:hypothetical protein
MTVGANHVVIDYWSGSSSSLQIDTGSATTANAGTNAAGGFTLGASGAGNGNNSDIYWYGGFVIGRALTTGETSLCESYWAAKF